MEYMWSIWLTYAKIVQVTNKLLCMNDKYSTKGWVKYAGYSKRKSRRSKAKEIFRLLCICYWPIDLLESIGYGYNVSFVASENVQLFSHWLQFQSARICRLVSCSVDFADFARIEIYTIMRVCDLWSNSTFFRSLTMAHFWLITKMQAQTRPNCTIRTLIDYIWLAIIESYFIQIFT